MINFIKSDFDVDIISQFEENYCLAKAKNEFIHFVFLNKLSTYYKTSQYYIHRYELANWLYDIEVCNANYSLSIGFNNIQLTYSKENEVLKIDYFGISFELKLKEINFGTLLLNDLSILNKVNENIKKPAFKKKMAAAIFDKEEKYSLDILSDNKLKYCAFEKQLFKTKKTWRKNTGLVQLARIESFQDLNINQYMIDSIDSSLPIVVGVSSCDCNDVDHCFFNILKKTYDTFFVEERLLTNKALDFEKVKTETNKIWNSLTSSQKSAMIYLDYVFENSLLFNLYLTTKDADFADYINKISGPYQPDSEDDIFLRKNLTIVALFLSL